jgi:hypothetical protein
MDYGTLLRRAWEITTRYPYLVVLGLFASGGFGGCSSTLNYQLSGSDLANVDPELEGSLGSAALWLSQNVWLIVALAVLLVLLALALLIVSSIATAGMARAATGLALGESVTAGEAWRFGRRRFLRYYGLAFLLIGIVAVGITAILLLISLAIAAGSAGGVGGTLLAILLGLAALFAILAAVPVGALLSIASQYAQLAMAVEDLGPVSALRSAIQLVRREAMTTFVIWLVSLALQIGAATVLAIAVAILVALLGGLGAVIYFATSGFGPSTLVYAVLAGLVLFAAIWGASAFVGTFLWSYWAQAYLKLVGRL